MHEHLEELYDLCETVNREIKEANEKIRKAGGKITAGDVDYVDKLTHTLKSIKTTIAMIEHEDDNEYSNDYRGGMSYARGGNRGGGRSYNRGGSYEGGSSYARGRRGNVRRDSMGRYSRDGGYSYDDAKEDMMSELREIMQDAPDDETKKEFKRFMSKLESM